MVVMGNHEGDNDGNNAATRNPKQPHATDTALNPKLKP